MNGLASLGANELLFYGGIIAAVIVIVLALIFFVSFYIGKIKLNSSFDREYGEEEKERR